MKEVHAETRKSLNFCPGLTQIYYCWQKNNNDLAM